MLWQFAELGWDSSIYTCSDGTVNDESNTRTGDCKLVTKHVNQWTQNWMDVPERRALYDTYARINELKIKEPVFNGAVTLSSGTFTPSIYISDNSITDPNTIKNVVILSNFSTTSQNITGNFPYIGTWYNLMDDTPLEVVATTDKITIETYESGILQLRDILGNIKYTQNISTPGTVFVMATSFPKGIYVAKFISSKTGKLYILSIFKE